MPWSPISVQFHTLSNPGSHLVSSKQKLALCPWETFLPVFWPKTQRVKLNCKSKRLPSGQGVKIGEGLKTGRAQQMISTFRIFPLEILDYILRRSINFGNFLVGETKIVLQFRPIYSPTEIFWFLVNGEQSVSLASFPVVISADTQVSVLCQPNNGYKWELPHQHNVEIQWGQCSWLHLYLKSTVRSKYCRVNAPLNCILLFY